MIPFRHILLISALAAAPPLAAQERNGFDVSNATVPLPQILSGGPPRDGIPSIDRPRFEDAAAASRWLGDEDLVVGVSVGDEHRAYPLRILVWHEIVNDTVGGLPVAVTYCPLCGTSMTFERRQGDDLLTFGVSGLLYQSDVLMFDRETESLWSQLAMESVSGPRVGQRLEWVPSPQMTWEAWRASRPGTKVLSRETGFPRDYDRMPYQGYEDQPETMFPVPHYRDELGNKEWVAGVVHRGESGAFHMADLAERGSAAALVLGGEEVLVRYDPDSKAAFAKLADGSELPVVQVFWFAWQAFYPDTQLWSIEFGVSN